MESPKISLCIPSYSGIHAKTVDSLMYCILNTDAIFHFNFLEGTLIHKLRNTALDNARELKADYLMFIDSDLTFPEHSIQVLINDNFDIVGGMYHMKELPLINTIKMLDENGNKLSGKVKIPSEPFKCYAIPTGFMLIKLDAIKSLKNPFQFDVNDDGSYVGEDIYFCRKAKEIGLDIWCDPRIEIGHIGNYIY